MGYGASGEAPKFTVAAAVSQATRGERMYPLKPRVGGGSVALAVASTFDRLESRLRDDPEKLAQMRADRRAVTKVLEERQVSFESAHAMLSCYFDHATSRRSAEAIANRWPSEWERIRLEAGSTE